MLVSRFVFNFCLLFIVCRGTIKFATNFKIGDSRTTQTTMLTAMVLLNTHLHNYFADGLAKINTHWDDERLFQEARRIAIAVYQRITYNEWVPLFLGCN